MKKTFVSIIILLCLIKSVIGQNLVDTNNVWYVVQYGYGGPYSTSIFYFKGDTTIGSINYKKLLFDVDSLTYFFPIPIAAREDTATKQVFFYDDFDGEYLIYDFSLNKNDTFSTYNGMCNIQYIVDSIDTVTLLNGEKRKRLFFSSSNQETWIEGIGSLTGLFSVGLYQCVADYYNDLTCFKENDTLKYHNSVYPVCYYSATGIIEEDLTKNFSINPNPFSDFTTLSVLNLQNENLLLAIYNSTGQLIRKTANIIGSKIIIERGYLKSGLYLFLLTSDRQCIGKGKLMIE